MKSCSRRKILIASTALVSASTVAALTAAAQNLGGSVAKPGSYNQSSNPSSSSTASATGTSTGMSNSSTAGAAGIAGGGAAPSPGPSASASASPSPGQATQREVYTATLNPANPSAPYGSATGQVTLVVDGGQVGVFITASGLAPNVMHEQHIHSGSTCATMANDTNGDGYIDDAEAEAVAGKPVVALGLNGLTPLSGSGSYANIQYPTAAPDGVETYIGSAPLSSIQAVMQSAQASPLPSPFASPLGTAPFIFPTASPMPSVTASAGPSGVGATGTPGAAGTAATGNNNSSTAGLFNNRVVEIHGISDTFQLPSTVAANEPGKTANQTLPVACGVLTQVTE